MTIDYSSAQAIYDHVCRHIAVQGFRATNGLMCRYRGAGGASCAVGCLIPDKDYFGLECRILFYILYNKSACLAD